MRYHSYLFFDADRSMHALDAADLARRKKSFVEIVERTADVRVRAYATLAFKPGTRFMLHVNAETLDAVQLLARDLLRTELGKCLTIAHALLGMTRASQYAPKRPPAQSAPDAPHRYLVVYPFTKTVEWHLLPHETRRGVMKAHVDVGRKFSDRVSQLLLYSYGIDDHEFIVSYQMDDLEAFQTLVMEMRETESRRHTKNDLPIFTCIHMPLAEALEML